MMKRRQLILRIISVFFVIGTAFAFWYHRHEFVIHNTSIQQYENVQWAVDYPHYTPDETVLQNQPPGPTGYVPSPAATKAFLKLLPKATLREAGPELYLSRGDDDPILLYRALQKAYREHGGQGTWTVGRQGIGDCVSWGWAHGADIHLATMYCEGDSGEWRPAATEPIYGGSRVEAVGKSSGGWQDGSYGAAAAKWVKDWGILFREPYDGVDLSTYSAERAKQWGNYGCGGKNDSGNLDGVAKKHPVKNVALVGTYADAVAAITSGYPVAVCSNQGFGSTRDSEGFLAARGTWFHCMVFIGVRHDTPGLLCLNSWGPNWVDGPKWPSDQLDGSFWVNERTVDKMLGQGDSFAVSGYQGFPARKLNHENWVKVDTQVPTVFAQGL